MKDKVLHANVLRYVEGLCRELRAYTGESMTFTLTVITRAKGAVSDRTKGVPDWYKANAKYTEATDNDDCIFEDAAKVFYGPNEYGEEAIVLVQPYEAKESEEQNE